LLKIEWEEKAIDDLEKLDSSVIEEKFTTLNNYSLGPWLPSLAIAGPEGAAICLV